MENFKIESRYLKLCYEFKAFIRYMKAPDQIIKNF